ncbi:MAG: hypothetical protein CMH54_05915 [Myxococcales bacterium]|nr:hypothetical protein [Myxococcales bacterium]
MSDKDDKTTDDSQEESSESFDLVGREFLGRYRLLEQIGEGGMSVVYRAQHLKMDSIVAVKVLSRKLMQDDDQVRSFNKEAFACSRLRHPNTIKVFDFGESSDGFLFLVMEFLEGETLGDLLRREGRLERSRALHIARQICKSLAEAHSVGIVHRDMKPENVFITEVYGEKDFAKVLDFGIAKVLDVELRDDGAQSGGGRFWGSPLYLSPEQFLDKPVNPSSDLYSLGCVIYEMLVGVPPFVSKKALDVVMAHIESEPRAPSELAPDLNFEPALDKLVLDLLKKDPANRPKTAEQLLRSLDDVETAVVTVDPTIDFLEPDDEPSVQIVATEGTGEKPALTPQTDSRTDIKIEEPSRPRFLMMGVLLVLIAGVAGVFLLRQNDSNGKSRPDIQNSTDTRASTIASKADTTTTPAATPDASRADAVAAVDTAPSKAADVPPPKPTLLRKHVLVSSEPPGATILVDGMEIGETPEAFFYDEENPPSEITLKKKGFVEQSKNLSPQLIRLVGDEGIVFRLDKKKVTRPRRPKKKDPFKNAWE